MVDEEVLHAFLKLRLAHGIGAVTYRRLADAFGDIRAIVESTPRWTQVDGIGPKARKAIEDVSPDQVREEVEIAAKLGVKIICAQDDEYPSGLKTIYDHPPVLYVRGELGPADAVALGVVGARRCTHYGLEQAQRFGNLLAGAGFTIVSGGARGIDTFAHRGAMAAQGRTLVVMGCGLAHVYPKENRKLFDQIVESRRGALISELPMRTAVLAGNFPTRNRIISGLSLGLVVIEAARRSGSLITARVAAEQGRCVMAVPGRVDNATSQGTNELIRNGAILVQNLDDVLEELGEVGRKLTPEEDSAGLFAHMLDGDEKVIAECMSEGSLPLDQLVDRTGLSTQKVLGALTMLTIKGVVGQEAGNIFRLKRGPKNVDA